MVSIPNNSNNLINQLSKTIKQIEDGINGYRSWLCKQSLPIETAVVTTTNAIGGAAIGAVYGSLANNNPFFSVVKVADFGVARFQSQGGEMIAETGTYRWMAPEIVPNCLTASYLAMKQRRMDHQNLLFRCWSTNIVYC
ncbi:hypothetical protein MKW94_021073 [Papaver nudicaule]|uniref:Protein kinase domain-containing protein n=1 Tax=Papaver nudicaule TaxID=74823 RepID=A0AA41VH46_PAPNU|nr:hypothetical protein [Papaver nudicaule]